MSEKRETTWMTGLLVALGIFALNRFVASRIRREKAAGVVRKWRNKLELD